MLIRFLIYMHGGMWSVKRKCIKARYSFLRDYYRLIYRYYQLINGCSIEWPSYFENEPCLPHGKHGIFISGTAKIGVDCVIFHHVTIGSNTLPDSKGRGAPVIGSNCYIGTGAKIIGQVKIGNNVRIGANAVVVQDVPDNCLVVSTKQTNIQRKNTLNNKYFSFQGDTWNYFSNGKWLKVDDLDILNNLASTPKKEPSNM